MKYILLIIYITLFLYGCSQENPNTASKYKNTVSLYEKNYSEITALEKSGSIFFGGTFAPSQLILFENNFFLVNRGFPKIHIYDYSRLNCIKIINKGKGPYETIKGRKINISKSNRELLFYSTDKHKAIIYNVDSLINFNNEYYPSNDNTRELLIENKDGFSQKCFLMGDKLLLISPMYNNNNLFTIFDSTGKYLTQGGAYPDYPKISDKYRPLSYTINAVVKSDNSKFALFYMETDLFEIYDNNGNLITKIHGPDRFYTKIEEVDNGNAFEARRIENTSRAAYDSCIECDDGNIWVAYSGKKELNSISTNFNYIYVYDWNGCPVKRYELDANILSFDVDVNKKIIYVIDSNNDNNVSMYRF